MGDGLTSQLRQLAFAIVTGQCRLTDGQRQAIADLNAAAALATVSAGPLTSPGERGRVQLRAVEPEKEPA